MLAHPFEEQPTQSIALLGPSSGTVGGLAGVLGEVIELEAVAAHPMDELPVAVDEDSRAPPQGEGGIVSRRRGRQQLQPAAAVDPGTEALAVQGVYGRECSRLQGVVENRGHEIEIARHGLVAPAFRSSWGSDECRHVDLLIVEVLAVSELVVLEGLLTVVGSEEEQTVLEPATLFQLCDQLAELLVEVGDLVVVEVAKVIHRDGIDRVEAVFSEDREVRIELAEG